MGKVIIELPFHIQQLIPVTISDVQQTLIHSSASMLDNQVRHFLAVLLKIRWSVKRKSSLCILREVLSVSSEVFPELPVLVRKSSHRIKPGLFLQRSKSCSKFLTMKKNIINQVSMKTIIHFSSQFYYLMTQILEDIFVQTTLIMMK